MSISVTMLQLLLQSITLFLHTSSQHLWIHLVFQRQLDLPMKSQRIQLWVNYNYYVLDTYIVCVLSVATTNVW